MPLLLAQAQGKAQRRYRGICYYDEGEGQWMVLDLQGRRLPRASSPIQEAQVFTLFDEARCRGADLRLRGDAVGLLTLGPATCKDKLMQVGREGWAGRGDTCGARIPAALLHTLASLALPDWTAPALLPGRAGRGPAAQAG